MYYYGMQITQIQQIFPFLYYPQPYRLKISAIWLSP